MNRGLGLGDVVPTNLGDWGPAWFSQGLERMVEMLVLLRVWVQGCCVWRKLHRYGGLSREVSGVPSCLGAWTGRAEK